MTQKNHAKYAAESSISNATTTVRTAPLRSDCQNASVLMWHWYGLRAQIETMRHASKYQRLIILLPIARQYMALMQKPTCFQTL